jgi:DNA-binding transcriptional ArsR family regulator
MTPRAKHRVEDRIAAFGDPVRRAILEMLAEGPRSVGDISGRLPISRPAVSQHLKVLSEAGLIAHDSVGTRNLYRIEPERVAEVRDYLDDLWHKALGNLKARIEKPHQ